MLAEDILTFLRRNGATVRVDAGKIWVSAPDGVLTDELRAEIRRQKPELLAIIQEEGQPIGQNPEFKHIKFPVELSTDWFPGSFWIVESDADAEELAQGGTPPGQIWTIPQIEKIRQRRDSTIPSEVQFIEEVISEFSGKAMEIRIRPKRTAT